MKNLLLFIFVTINSLSWAQSQSNDLSFTLGTQTIPMFDDNRFGFFLESNYFVTDAFSVGLKFDYATTKFENGFGYDTDFTMINSYKVSVPFQYNIVNSEKFLLGVGFSNGVLFNVLRNGNEIEEVEYFDEDQTNVLLVPKKITTDTFYTLTPFTNFSYKLVTIDTTDQVNLFLTGGLGYQNAFGKRSFSKGANYSNYIVSLGLTIRGSLN